MATWTSRKARLDLEGHPEVANLQAKIRCCVQRQQAKAFAYRPNRRVRDRQDQRSGSAFGFLEPLLSQEQAHVPSSGGLRSGVQFGGFEESFGRLDRQGGPLTLGATCSIMMPLRIKFLVLDAGEVLLV